jgi:lipoate-protein ligase A
VTTAAKAQAGPPTSVADLGIGRYEGDDHWLAEARRVGRAAFRVYVPAARTLVLGRGSDAAREANLEACARESIPVNRRSGGGCAVVLDEGNLVVTAGQPLPGLDRIRETYDAWIGWLVLGLTRAGVAGVRREGSSDLAIGDRKISGSCVHRTLGWFTYSATLLVDPDVTLMGTLLHHPPREPGYRRGRSHSAFVGRLVDLAGTERATPFAARLRETLSTIGLPGDSRSPTENP